MAQSRLITTIDEFQAEYRKTIGDTLAQRPTRRASLDNVRRFGDGIGDYNPLWRNEDHAAASRFGMITAPPTFLYSVALGVVAGETGNIDRARVSTQYLPVNYAGVEIDFVRPVWRDDLITATERVGETVRKQSGRIGAINLNTGLVTYTNQRRETVADVRTVMARYQNTGGTLDYDRAAKDAGAPPEPADPLVWERQRRGAETRYWEDVAQGDTLPALPKGTYSVSELFPVHLRRAGYLPDHAGCPGGVGFRRSRRRWAFRRRACEGPAQHARPVRLRAAARLLAGADRDGLDGRRRHAQTPDGVDPASERRG